MSCCTTTVSNSVRNNAPVGHASRQGALWQCLQTSLIISHPQQRRQLIGLDGGAVAEQEEVSDAVAISNWSRSSWAITKVPAIDCMSPPADGVQIGTSSAGRRSDLHYRPKVL